MHIHAETLLLPGKESVFPAHNVQAWLPLTRLYFPVPQMEQF